MPNKTEMNCSDVEPLLFDYSDGLLPEPVRDRISRHLALCTSCASAHRLVSGINQTIEQEKVISPDPFLSTRLLQHLESGLEKYSGNPISQFKPLFQPALITLGLLIALLSGILLGHSETRTNPTSLTENTRVENLKSELFINDFVDEDQTLFLNN